MTISLQEMAVSYVNYLKQELRDREKHVQEQMQHIEQLKRHIAECESQLFVSNKQPESNQSNPFTQGLNQ